MVRAREVYDEMIQTCISTPEGRDALVTGIIQAGIVFPNTSSKKAHIHFTLASTLRAVDAWLKARNIKSLAVINAPIDESYFPYLVVDDGEQILSFFKLRRDGSFAQARVPEKMLTRNTLVRRAYLVSRIVQPDARMGKYAGDLENAPRLETEFRPMQHLIPACSSELIGIYLQRASHSIGLSLKFTGETRSRGAFSLPRGENIKTGVANLGAPLSSKHLKTSAYMSAQIKEPATLERINSLRTDHSALRDALGSEYMLRVAPNGLLSEMQRQLLEKRVENPDLTNQQLAQHFDAEYSRHKIAGIFRRVKENFDTWARANGTQTFRDYVAEIAPDVAYSLDEETITA